MGPFRLPHFAYTNLLTAGPLAAHAEAITQHFATGRYAQVTMANYLSNIAHFARWARSKRLRICRIDEACVTAFLDQHLPQCRCDGPVRHDRVDHRAALGHLLVVLRVQGFVTLRATSATPVDEELQRFDVHTDCMRGLALKHRTQVLRVVGRLLRQRVGADRKLTHL